MLTLEEIGRFISDDYGSERKRRARVGRRYYGGDHDIRRYRLYYYDADGKLVEDTTRSNIKIPHPFFTELVDQCVQYMLSGEGPAVRADDPKLQAELDAYFGDEFTAELAETLTDACTDGAGTMYAYKRASDARTAFVYADAMGVVEVRAKDTDDAADHVIYWYVDRIDKGRKEIKRIQVWDEKETRYYVQADNGKIADDDSAELNPRPHIVYSEDGERFGGSFGFIPFFRLDANRRQESHLKPIKDLIDDYDLMSCGLSNNIQDVSEAVWVVKGFQGENLDEMIKNIKTKKHVGVDDDGDVDIRTVDIPREARVNKLEIDEKNIYRFGMGFNAAQVGDGNVTNVVIKSRYALLDLKCNKLENKLRAFMRKLVKVAVDEVNQRNGTAYAPSDVEVSFEREVMTNAYDNAQIALAEAQAKQTELGTLLNAAAAYGEDVVLDSVCTLLDLDPEEIGERLAEPQDGGLNAAVAALGGAEDPPGEAI